MFVEWTEKLSIGIPEIDVEHKFLVALVNSLHGRMMDDESQGALAETFSHLLRYTERHFANEESLMRAIGFPDIDKHEEQHFDLTDQATELSKLYISGAKAIDVELLKFLKTWISHHILEEDIKISKYLDGKSVPSDWGFIPAFSDDSESYFKACTFCGKTWRTFSDFSEDSDICLLDQMVDRQNHFYNLLLFNCSCGTTLAVPLFDLVKADPKNFFLEENSHLSEKPNYCLSSGSESPCSGKCACSYTSRTISKLAASKCKCS